MAVVANRANAHVCSDRFLFIIYILISHKVNHLFSTGQLYHLQIAEHPFINRESHQRAHLMKPVDARRPGIDVQHPQRLVILHLQDVRVSADEQLGRMHQQAALYRGVILARIAAYVLHQHLRPLHTEPQRLREEPTDLLPVDIAIHRPQRPEVRQTLCHLQRTDVTGMPYLVARLKVVQVLLVPVSVRIR